MVISMIDFDAQFFGNMLVINKRDESGNWNQVRLEEEEQFLLLEVLKCKNTN